MTFLHYTLKSRENFVSLLNTYSNEALNQVPEGFNNNLIWNFGHVIVTQQLLCYKLSGLDMYVSDEMVNDYRKGSKPEKTIEEGEISRLKELSVETVDLLRRDLEKGLFKDYHEYTTSFGVTLHNVEEAIQFNSMHETLHLGYAMALRKKIESM
jgi:hypothetical protein